MPARDPEESVRLFRLAAAVGDPDAKRVLQRIEKRAAAPAPEQQEPDDGVMAAKRAEIMARVAAAQAAQAAQAASEPE